MSKSADGRKITNIAFKGLSDRKGLDPKMFGAYDRVPLAWYGYRADEGKK